MSIFAKVNLNSLRERYDLLSKHAGSTSIIPVIKNNSNGLGFEEMFNLFSSKDNVKMIATSYASEMLRVKSNGVKKLSWIWEVENYKKEYNAVAPEYRENIELCCKDFEQVRFCLKNYINPHIVFNLGMNRGGFKECDLKSLKEILNNRSIYVTAHCPYGPDMGHKIKEYLDNFWKLIKKMQDMNFHIIGTHNANSAVYKYCVENNCQELMGNFARVGEFLLLPQQDNALFGSYEPIRVTTNISYIMKLKNGENIGYNHMVLDSDRVVALIPCGYYNFHDLKYVGIKAPFDKYFCKVLAGMHDTTIIDITHIYDSGETINNGWEVEIMSKDMMTYNWDRCIQKTYKFNPDMVIYEYQS